MRHPNRPARPPAPMCAVDVLERRALFAAAGAADFATLDGDGVLSVQGTAAADVISVALVPGNDIAVTLADQVLAFPSGRVSRLYADGGDGDDLVELAPDLKLRSSLLGSGGNDTLLGGDQDDLLDGGAGNDRLGGRGGQDTILGGADNDSIDGGDGRDEIHGGEGNDQIIAGGGRDVVFGDAGSDRFGTFDDRIDTIFGGPGADLLFADPLNLEQLHKRGDVWSEVEAVFY